MVIKEKKIIYLKHQGFCFGVINAINIVKKYLQKKSKDETIYFLGGIVHNSIVNDYFRNQGVIILDGKTRLTMLDLIDSGTIIITAHGVSPEVMTKAREKGLKIIDCTCPFVKLAVDNINKYLNNDYDIIYVGKLEHPETESLINYNDHLHIIYNDLDLQNLIIYFKKHNITKLAIAGQTTITLNEITLIKNKMESEQLNIQMVPSVCSATKLRQDELIKTISDLNNDNPSTTLYLIIGDLTSNNTNKLQSTITKLTNANNYIISSLNELDNIDLSLYSTIVITSGTSTPNYLVDEIYDKIKSL